MTTDRRRRRVSREERLEQWLANLFDQPLKIAWIALASVTVFLVVVGGVLVRLTDPHHIHSIWQGLWWSTQTITTVGYGDVIPESALGRLIGAAVMLGGIAFLTVTTAAITSLFVDASRRKRPRAPDDPVQRELAALRAEVRGLTGEVRAARGGPPDTSSGELGQGRGT
jgi:voltage-gated potassium channel